MHAAGLLQSARGRAPQRRVEARADEEHSFQLLISGAGVSDRASDFSSLGDSGEFSEASGGRRGIGELLYKGFAANLKILSKSGQQMVKLVRKDATDLESSPTVSSQSLIMEARPPGVPAKSAKEQWLSQWQQR